ncbi:hypothetical protein MHB40_20535 [Lysinibacillus sp. FSL K6-0057]|uniref:hypothetical protein n=1 Tax=unclassified Lysinibacillus TaxID=2636778 RepID=UPI00315A018E
MQKKQTKRKVYDYKVLPRIKEIRGWVTEGLTQKQIASNLGISQSSFYNILNEYPDFRKALDMWSQPANIELENSMMKSAKGFYYTEKKEYFDADGELVNFIVDTKFSKPDTQMQKFLALNRMSEFYREKIEFENNSDTEFVVRIFDENENEVDLLNSEEEEE